MQLEGIHAEPAGPRCAPRRAHPSPHARALRLLFVRRRCTRTRCTRTMPSRPSARAPARSARAMQTAAPAPTNPPPPRPPPGAWLRPKPPRLCTQCVGDQFAFAEATVILARVLQAPSPSPRSPRPEAPPAGALCAAALCAALTWSGGRSATTCRLQCPRRRWAWRRARPSTPRRGCPCGWRGAAPRCRREAAFD
jgi:hypothetical protein